MRAAPQLRTAEKKKIDATKKGRLKKPAFETRQPLIID
jgi:hypothetical protein|tara:strand:- start:3805 stop:3918 length:114 start_codon:yes stop_codon:yes gene_type:complete